MSVWPSAIEALSFIFQLALAVNEAARGIGRLVEFVTVLPPY